MIVNPLENGVALLEYSSHVEPDPHYRTVHIKPFVSQAFQKKLKNCEGNVFLVALERWFAKREECFKDKKIKSCFFRHGLDYLFYFGL